MLRHGFASFRMALALTVALVATSSAPAALISQWSFSGNALDSVGGRNGTLVNGASFSGNAAPGGGTQSLNLATFGDDQMQVDIVGGDTLSGNYTAAIWANPTDGTGFAGTFLGTRGGSDQSFDVKFQNNIQIHGDIGTGATWLNTGVDANNIDYKANVWTHVAYAVAPGEARIYANGIHVATHTYVAGTPLFFDATHDIAVGGDRTTVPAQENFSGLVDELKLYNTTLTPTEVLAAIAGPTRSRIPTFFSTGLDNAGNPLAGNVDDPHYAIISPAGPDVTIPQDGFPIPPWLSNDAQSQWIGPAHPSNDGEAGAGNFTYRTTFDLTGFDPSTAFVTGLWATDNTGVDILINGQSVGLGMLPDDSSAASFAKWTPFNVTTGFVGGVNTLDFVLNNGGGPSGLRVAGNAFAARLGGAIPEPATMSLLALGSLALLRRRRAA